MQIKVFLITLFLISVIINAEPLSSNYKGTVSPCFDSPNEATLMTYSLNPERKDSYLGILNFKCKNITEHHLILIDPKISEGTFHSSAFGKFNFHTISSQEIIFEKADKTLYFKLIKSTESKKLIPIEEGTFVELGLFKNKRKIFITHHSFDNQSASVTFTDEVKVIHYELKKIYNGIYGLLYKSTSEDLPKKELIYVVYFSQEKDCFFNQKYITLMRVQNQSQDEFKLFEKFKME